MGGCEVAFRINRRWYYSGLLAARELGYSRDPGARTMFCIPGGGQTGEWVGWDLFILLPERDVHEGAIN